MAAAEVGVKRLINPGVELANSRRVVDLVGQYPGIYAAIGFHPYDASQVTDETLVTLETLADNPKVVAIGEIGLDYYRDRASKADQRRAFEAQLELARSLNLPVIIHQREAAADTMAILRRWGASGDHPGLVLHAFSGDRAMAEEAVALGFYLGIGGPITFKNARDLPDIVKEVPLERILVETDAPFLSPHPYRGKRNEPARVRLVAEKLAELLAIELDLLAAKVTVNTETLFHLPQAI
jgi:TatD DNase family protein